MFTLNVTVILADAVRRAQSIVRQTVVFRYLSHQTCRRAPIVQFLTEEGVEDGSAGVQSLQFVLYVERLKDIVRKVYGQMRTVGVVRNVTLAFACRNDVGITLFVVFGKTVRS